MVERQQLQSRLEQLQNNHLNLTEKKGQLETCRMDKLKTNYDQLKTSSDKLQANYDQLKTKLETIRYELLTEEQCEAKLTNLTDEWKTKISNLTETKGQLESSYHVLNSSYDQLKTSSDKLESSYDQLKTRCDQLETIRSDIPTAEREQCEARLTNLTDELKTKISNLTETKGQLETRCDVLQSGYDQLKTSSDKLESSYDQLKTRCDQLETMQSENATAEREKFETRISNLTDECETKITNLAKERDELQMRLCGDGWQFFDGGCYYGSSELKTWEQSRQWCRDRQSDLVMIKSKEKKDFVDSFKKRWLWLGLSDSEAEGTFQWVDGTPLTAPTYWKRGEPHAESVTYTNEAEDCVNYYDGSHAPATAGWDDAFCTGPKYWICERSLG